MWIRWIRIQEAQQHEYPGGSGFGSGSATLIYKLLCLMSSCTGVPAPERAVRRTTQQHLPSAPEQDARQVPGHQGDDLSLRNAASLVLAVQ
jgi:hypothetical protein